MAKWETEDPSERIDVLAEVVNHLGISIYRVLRWMEGRGWYFDGSMMASSDRVLRWTPLEPIITEKPDKRIPGITHLVDLLKELNGGSLDKSGMARAHCKVMLTHFAKQFPDKDPVAVTEKFIRRAKADPFHGPKATSMLYLMSNRLRIINDLQKPSNGQQNSASKFAEGLAALGNRKG